MPVQWHHGFRATVDDISAVRQDLFDGQVLKRVWHCAARFGLPVADR